MFDDSMPLLMPILICIARIGDVSLGTLRTVAVVRGRVALATGLGFFEVLIWVFAVGSVVTELDNPMNILGYSTGYALGNAAGIHLEKKLALGHLVLRVISRSSGAAIAVALRAEGFRVTELDGRGMFGDVTILLVVVDRIDSERVQQIALNVDSEAFISMEESVGVNRALHPELVPLTGWRALVAKK